jgi:hypothetical protein
MISSVLPLLCLVCAVQDTLAAVTEAREHCTALARMAASLGAGIDIMLGGCRCG